MNFLELLFFLGLVGNLTAIVWLMRTVVQGIPEDEKKQKDVRSMLTPFLVFCGLLFSWLLCTIGFLQMPDSTALLILFTLVSMLLPFGVLMFIFIIFYYLKNVTDVSIHAYLPKKE